MPEPSVRIVRRDQLSDDTPQTPGLHRAVAFDSRNPDAKVLSAFLSTVLPGAATGAHHHGDQETILYVLEGTARYRWGDHLQ
ncbi:MAG TPA: mannose-6-phosphate isomerase, partial [Acetobacteraceae bacterium]